MCLSWCRDHSTQVVWQHCEDQYQHSQALPQARHASAGSRQDEQQVRITPHLPLQCPEQWDGCQPSLLLVAGVSLKTIQARLGHQDFGTTANTYSHLLEGAQAEAVAKVDELMSRMKNRG